MRLIPEKYEDFLNEMRSGNTFTMMYHGDKMDKSKPMYFSDSELVALSYGDVNGPYTLKLKKPFTVDFTNAEGWWLPEEDAKKAAKDMGVKFEYFDKFKDYTKIKNVKTDHFIKAAKEKGYDSVIFKNIMDAGSRPVKGNKYIRTTNVAVINYKSAKIIEE